jgi:hypothetical protein
VLGGKIMIRRFMLISAIVFTTMTGQVLTQHRSLAQTSRLSPYDVIFMAYQGQFREQGIRGYGAFVESCYQGQLSAKKIVQAAIQANRLPADAVNDEAYLKAIDANLLSLKSNVSP